MGDTYEINEHDEVVPYVAGRRSNDTREWRDATPLELSQRDDIDRLEKQLVEAATAPVMRATILRHWSREEIEAFALHLLGDEWQQLKAENEKMREYAEGLSRGWSEAEGGRVATFYGRLKNKEKEDGI